MTPSTVSGDRVELAGPPVVDAGSAAALCEEHFFAPRTIQALDGYQDATFRVEDGRGAVFTFKLAPTGEDDALRRERTVLRHLERREWPGVPRPLTSRAGMAVERVRIGARELDARLLTWVKGTPMVSTAPWPPGLLGELGSYLGGLDLVLGELGSVGERSLDWDLARAGERRDDLGLVDDADDRAMVESVLEDYLELRARLAPTLPRGLIHNDANTHNVLVSPPGKGAIRLVGLIDFGDLVVTETVHELAVAAAYLGFGRADPWRAVRPLVRGYDRARPLSEGELELLLPAIRVRLAMSVLMAQRRRRAGTADAYALVSERDAWETLRRLSSVVRELDRTEETEGMGHE